MTTLWKQIPEEGRLKVFVRESAAEPSQDESDGGAREVRLCGVFDDANELATIINVIHMAAWSGEFYVHVEGVQKILFFRHGVFLAGHSPLVSDRLGSVLVSMKLVTEEQCNACAGSVVPGDRLGQALVREGHLTTSQVYDGLCRQSEEIFYSGFRQGRGSYHLIAPLQVNRLPALLRLDTQSLLMNAVKRLDEERAGIAVDVPSASREVRDAVPEPIDPLADTKELRRRAAIPDEELPQGGATLIASTYNEAIGRLFSVVDQENRLNLRRQLVGFVHDEGAPYRRLFHGVIVRTDGQLDTEALLHNVKQLGRDGVTELQNGLSELLFFVLFAAGDAVEEDTQALLERNVESVLRRLPNRRPPPDRR